MRTLWYLHNWWLDQRAAFLNSPTDHKEDTILGVAACVLFIFAILKLL